MVCSLKCCVASVAVGIGAIVATAISPVIGVLGTGPGLYYYFKRKNELQAAQRNLAEAITRLSEGVLNDTSRCINGKNYMSKSSVFTTDEELSELKERLRVLNKNPIGSALELTLVQSKLNKAQKKFNEAAAWVASIALCIIPVIGFALAVYRHFCKGGIFEKASEASRNPYQVFETENNFLNDVGALNHHIKKVEALHVIRDKEFAKKTTPLAIAYIETADGRGSRQDTIREVMGAFMNVNFEEMELPLPQAGPDANPPPPKVKLVVNQTNPPPASTVQPQAVATIVPVTMDHFTQVLGLNGMQLVNVAPGVTVFQPTQN